MSYRNNGINKTTNWSRQFATVCRKRVCETAKTKHFNHKKEKNTYKEIINTVFNIFEYFLILQFFSVKKNT